MKKGNKNIILVKGTPVTILSFKEEDFISLTDMVQGFEGGLALIERWLRNKNTLEFLGIWERINNPDFNSLEFEGIKNNAGLNRFHISAKKTKLIPPKLDRTQQNGIYATEADLLNMALFGLTAKQWRNANPEKAGNIRDHASLEQLIVLANIESMNAEFIKMDLPQAQRLEKLNDIAIGQMKSLAGHQTIQQLKEGGQDGKDD